jgi:hypothetical protein
MAHRVGWTGGSLWVDHALPLAIGVLCALVVKHEGGPFWTVLVVPASCWFVWQLARRVRGRLGVRILLVTFVAAVILGCFFLFFSVDTAKLRQAVADAGIGVKMVSSDRNWIVVSILPVSWGPERNLAMRAIFSAAHTYARSKNRVRIQRGDAMVTTVKMKDIGAFMAGKITYREMLNRMDWSGTPDVLPDDSSGIQIFSKSLLNNS